MASTRTMQNDLPVVSPQAGHLQASLALAFERLAGRTVLTASKQEPPLRVVRAFPLEDGAALVHLHNLSGGLLGGDCIELEMRLGAGASAQVTTTGATRLYRPRAEAPVTLQTNTIRVAEDALLEYVPDPIIPFAHVRFCQRTSIELSPGAGMFWWEILAPGREAYGELFAYDSVELTMEVRALGRPMLCDHARLQPKKYALESRARLGHYRYWATFYLCRVGPEPGFWLDAEQRLRGIARELNSPGDVLWGISTLVAHGLVVRCVAREGHSILAGLREIWRAAKLLMYNREPIPPRKVN
jgi:urease accessory protein